MRDCVQRQDSHECRNEYSGLVRQCVQCQARVAKMGLWLGRSLQQQQQQWQQLNHLPKHGRLKSNMSDVCHAVHWSAVLTRRVLILCFRYNHMPYRGQVDANGNYVDDGGPPDEAQDNCYCPRCVAIRKVSRLHK